MQQAEITNVNDFKVVSFHNSTNFCFTPEMGCMYDGRPINGKTGKSGIDAGEEIILPYHIGNQLALNLAKAYSVQNAPTIDPVGIPTGVSLWTEESIEKLKSTFIKELYTEERPVKMSETDILMAKIEEYKSMVDKVLSNEGEEGVKQTKGTYKSKADIISELESKGITHDKRKTREELEELLK
jgi:hypothetical protein